MTYYDGGRLVSDPAPARLTDDQRNQMAELQGEDRCGETFKPGRITYECVLEVDHDGPHESHAGFVSWYSEDEEPADDDTSDWREPDTVWEARGEK